MFLPALLRSIGRSALASWREGPRVLGTYKSDLEGMVLSLGYMRVDHYWSNAIRQLAVRVSGLLLPPCFFANRIDFIKAEVPRRPRCHLRF